MKVFKENKVLFYPADALFDIIIDIDKYSEFLPWCVASKIQNRLLDGTLVAELSIGFGSLRENFTSNVVPNRANLTIHSKQLVGPFKTMQSRWSLRQKDKISSEVYFDVEFEFRSIILEKMMGSVFDMAAKKMISAFEKRAAAIL